MLLPCTAKFSEIGMKPDTYAAFTNRSAFADNVVASEDNDLLRFAVLLPIVVMRQFLQ